MHRVFISAALLASVALPTLANAQGFPAFQNGPANGYEERANLITNTGRSSARAVYRQPHDEAGLAQRSYAPASEYFFPPFLPF